jgi:predicted regulator of Ras-like GTPase activity (Roadblock/LC7/MglB family)
MKALLTQVNTVPGVVGSMVCNLEGSVVAKTFPSLFDDADLANAARILVDGAAGLETVTGKIGMVDLRYGDSRIIVRPMTGAHLVLLCTGQTNLQMLSISTAVALPKLEKLLAAPPPPSTPAAPPVSAKAEAPAKPGKKEKEKDKGPPPEDPGLFHW